MDRNEQLRASLLDMVRQGRVKLFRPLDDAAGTDAEAVERPASVPARQRAPESSNTGARNPNREDSGGGVDWLSAAVFGEKAPAWYRIINKLEEAKTVAQEEGRAALELHPLEEPAEVMAYGSGKGANYCRYVLMWRGIRIELSDYDGPDDSRPTARITIPGRVLLQHDLVPAIELAQWALYCLGVDADQSHWQVSRLDLCVDVTDVDIEDVLRETGYCGQGVVTRARNFLLISENLKAQTLQIGLGYIKCRIYDKLAETENDYEKRQLMIANRWGDCEPDKAIRVEYQLHRKILKEAEIETLADVFARLDELVSYCTKWCRITGEDVDRDHSDRNEGTPFWRDVVKRFQEWAGNAPALKRSRDVVPDITNLVQQAVGVMTSIAAKTNAKTATHFRRVVDQFLSFGWNDSAIVKSIEEKRKQYISHGSEQIYIPQFS